MKLFFLVFCFVFCFVCFLISFPRGGARWFVSFLFCFAATAASAAAVRVTAAAEPAPAVISSNSAAAAATAATAVARTAVRLQIGPVFFRWGPGYRPVVAGQEFAYSVTFFVNGKQEPAARYLSMTKKRRGVGLYTHAPLLLLVSVLVCVRLSFSFFVLFNAFGFGGVFFFARLCVRSV